MPRRRRKFPFKLDLPPETIFSIAAVCLITLGVLIMVSFSNQGAFLRLVNTALRLKLGLAMLFLPFVFISSGLVLFRTSHAWSKPNVLLGTILLMFSVLGAGKSGQIGREVFANLASLLTPIGTIAFFVAIGVCGLLIITQWSWAEIIEWLSKFKPKPSSKATEFVGSPVRETWLAKEDKNDQKSSGWSLPKLGLFSALKPKNSPETGAVSDVSDKEDSADSKSKSPDPEIRKLSLTNPAANTAMLGKQTDGQGASQSAQVWEYPPLSLLSSRGGGTANRGDVKGNAQIIENTLDSFGISAHVKEVNKGPAVTQYALEIAQGTKLSRITSLSTDLALALAAPTGQIRIEAPIAGRALVGVEVPNHSAQFVTLREMIASKTMKEHKSKLAVALGIGVSGEHIVADIARMPHLLIAGATGSGKSVAVNSFLCSILFRASPEEVKFILVDPKRVELTGYNDIPHLMTPVIVEPNKVVSALKWATQLMDQRYKQLAEVGVKNISDYNELAGLAAMPNLIIVIDELADIMLFAPAEVEENITRLAQMARAVGIHLVLATQRPSVDVITGLIKANVPTRIAFNVSSVTDSRVILDSPGAEKLLGRGDMLYLPPDRAKPLRIQGTYVNDQEIKSLIDFLKSQGRKPEYQEEILTKYKSNMVKGGSGGGTSEVDKDDLFDQAARLFTQYDKASSSLIQRRLSVGYARAARILDQLYEAGFVGPAEGSKPRDVNTTKIMDYLSSVQKE